MPVITLAAFSLFMCTTVFITLVRNDYWLFKVMEYPRLQKLALILATLAVWFAYLPLESTASKVSFLLLCFAAAYLFYKVSPYTFIYPREMKRVKAVDAGKKFSVFAANVLQTNREYHRMLQQIEATDPDIVFLVETDEGWATGMAQLEEKYPYTLKQPLNNTYGLLLYSRLPLRDARVNFLVKDDIPSVEAIAKLPCGDEIKLYGLHPEPPVPGENLYSTAKDKELMKVALTVKECNMPCVVFGDLNDVAWSHTTELFRKTSGLLDPRRGRGFYSTFSAKSIFMRFPLDYIFCSPQFGLVQMKRMPKNGSDHFATFTTLALVKQLEQVQEAPRADKEDIQEAKEKAAQPVKE